MFYRRSYTLLLSVFFTSGTSTAAKFLRGNGVTLFKVRDETINLLGKSDMYFFSPEHPPLTEPARKAIDWAIDEKKKSGVYKHLSISGSFFCFFPIHYNQLKLFGHRCGCGTNNGLLAPGDLVSKGISRPPDFGNTRFQRR